MQLYRMSSYMKLKSCGELKFLENYSMISTYALHVVFLSSITIVNEDVVKTIVNEGLSLTKGRRQRLLLKRRFL